MYNNFKIDLIRSECKKTLENLEITIYCLVTSKEDWHRCGNVDDSVGITYEIIPRN